MYKTFEIVNEYLQKHYNTIETIEKPRDKRQGWQLLMGNS